MNEIDAGDDAGDGMRRWDRLTEPELWVSTYSVAVAKTCMMDLQAGNKRAANGPGKEREGQICVGREATNAKKRREVT